MPMFARNRTYRCPLDIVPKRTLGTTIKARPVKLKSLADLSTGEIKNLQDQITGWIESLYIRGYQFEHRKQFRRGLEWLSSPDSVWWDYIEAKCVHAQFNIDMGKNVSYLVWVAALDKSRFPLVQKKKRLYKADGTLKFKKVASFVDFTIYSVSREWESMESVWNDRPFHPPE